MSALGTIAVLTFTFAVSFKTAGGTATTFPNDNHTTLLITKQVGEFVHFQCIIQSTRSGTWQKETDGSTIFLFAGRTPVRRENKNMGIYPNNYSLYIHPISLNDDGIYMCKDYGTIVSRYRLRVQATKHDAIKISGEVFNSMRFDCNVSDFSQATWEKSSSDGDFLLFGERYGREWITDSNMHVLRNNFSLVLRALSIADVGLYSCKEKGKPVAQYNLTINVIPELRIQHRKTNLSKEFFATKGERLQLKCVIFRDFGDIELKWYIENETLQNGYNTVFSSPNKFAKGLHDFTISLTYIFTEDVEVTCIRKKTGDTDIKVTVSVLESNQMLKVIIGSFSLMTVFLLVFGIFCYRKRRKRNTSIIENERKRQSSTHMITNIGSHHLEDTLSKSDTNVIHGKTNRPLPDFPNQGICSYSRKIRSFRGMKIDSEIYHEPLTRDLQNIPCERRGTLHPYSQKIAQLDEVYYTLMDENIRTAAVFDSENVDLITPLKMGVFCERWMGTLMTPEGQPKSVYVIKPKRTVEVADVSWKALVKKLLELPECPYFLQTVGICVDEADLFILQNFIKCEPLNTSLVKASGKDYEKCIEWGIQICRGIEFANAHGLCHPALSTRTVLLHSRNICKLFDVCIMEDAHTIARVIMSQPDNQLFSHPDELAVECEYTFASDVWYTATTIWEIFSEVSPPGNVVGNKVYDGVSSHVPLRPELCPLHIYNCLKDCWTKNQNYRPTIKNLRLNLEEAFSTNVVKE